MLTAAIMTLAELAAQGPDVHVLRQVVQFMARQAPRFNAMEAIWKCRMGCVCHLCQGSQVALPNPPALHCQTPRWWPGVQPEA